jgi:hypothetical protein
VRFHVRVDLFRGRDIGVGADGVAVWSFARLRAMQSRRRNRIDRASPGMVA